MITAIIIDDEALARDVILNMLKLYCPSVQVIGEAYDVASGVKAIKDFKPDVVFLDIQMPDGSGFDLLKQFPSINFKFVFITAYQEFAIKAFKFSALDYILKPVDPGDLVNAVEKLQETIEEEETNKKFQTFIENIQWNEKEPQKIILKTLESVIVAEIDSIVRCESQNNYTLFHFSDRPKLLVSRTLKDFDDMLSSSGFFRAHQSHLVNLSYVKKYNRFPESHLVLNDGVTVPVSVRKRELLAELMKKYNKSKPTN
ncbi:MAG: DNA-binding response regulator [Bacteroidetes bacterium HGW-Bacteroidetes-15]|nr:MAG: DNA-binding response regulator [Bacteroidetes bacterium HGW-Bacteroidetes-15]